VTCLYVIYVLFNDAVRRQGYTFESYEELNGYKRRFLTFAVENVLL